MIHGGVSVKNALSGALRTGDTHPPGVTDAVGAVTDICDCGIKPRNMLPNGISVTIAITSEGEITGGVKGWHTRMSAQRYIIVTNGVHPAGTAPTV